MTASSPRGFRPRRGHEAHLQGEPPAGHRRGVRHRRPVRHPVWSVRACCALALVGVVALATARRPPEPPRADPVAICVSLRVITATALYDRLPWPDASPEDVEAIDRLNLELRMTRQQIEEACK